MATYISIVKLVNLCNNSKHQYDGAASKEHVHTSPTIKTYPLASFKLA